MARFETVTAENVNGLQESQKGDFVGVGDAVDTVPFFLYPAFDYHARAPKRAGEFFVFSYHYKGVHPSIFTSVSAAKEAYGKCTRTDKVVYVYPQGTVIQKCRGDHWVSEILKAIPAFMESKGHYSHAGGMDEQPKKVEEVFVLVYKAVEPQAMFFKTEHDGQMAYETCGNYMMAYAKVVATFAGDKLISNHFSPPYSVISAY